MFLTSIHKVLTDVYCLRASATANAKESVTDTHNMYIHTYIHRVRQQSSDDRYSRAIICGDTRQYRQTVAGVFDILGVPKMIHTRFLVLLQAIKLSPEIIHPRISISIYFQTPLSALSLKLLLERFQHCRQGFHFAISLCHSSCFENLVVQLNMDQGHPINNWTVRFVVLYCVVSKQVEVSTILAISWLHARTCLVLVH